MDYSYESELVSTDNSIHELCGHCDRKDYSRISYSSPQECRSCNQEYLNSTTSHRDRRRECPPPRYDPGVSYFLSIITPLNNLTPTSSGMTGCVDFRMRRKNKTVTLQWESFSGNLAASGVAYLTVAQSICNVPPYILTMPVVIQYKGVQRNTSIQIDPFATNGNIKFYLNTDGSSSNTTMGDAVTVMAGAITWIVD